MTKGRKSRKKSRIPNETIEILRSSFTEADIDKSGTLDLHKMQILLSKMGLSIPEKEAEQMISSVAKRDRNELDFDDFLLLFDRATVRTLFKEFDKEGSGEITFENLKQSLHSRGWHATDNQIRDMIERVDTKGNGRIDFNEFYNYFRLVPNLDMQKVFAVWLTPPSKVQKLQEAFDLYDSNEDGFLNVNELNQAFHHLGLCLHDEEVIAILKRANQGRDVSISFYEFIALFDISNVCSLFNEIDVDEDGQLDFCEVKKAFEKIGWKLSDYQIDNLISMLDRTGNNMIDFEEFLDFFENLPLLDLRTLSHYWVSTPFITDFSGGSTLIPFLPNRGGSTPINYSLAAALSSLVSRSLTNPLERIKIVLQTQAGQLTSSPIAIAREIIAKEGWVGLWKGTGATTLRLVPFAGVVGAMNGFLLDKVPNKNSAPWRFFAIASAATIASTLTYPLDLIRTRMCLLEKEGEKKIDKHTHRALINLLKTEGLRGAYRGLVPTLLALPPFIALQQTTFEVLMRRWRMNVGDTGIAATFGLGVASGMFAQTVLFPMEVVRTRMQLPIAKSQNSNQFNYTGTFNALKTIAVKEGMRGLFKGIGTAYLRVAPNAAISLWIRDSALRYMEDRSMRKGHKHEHHEHKEFEANKLMNQMDNPFQVNKQNECKE